jgi:dihydrofolate synthase/folylpolyglutamate synthase
MSNSIADFKDLLLEIQNFSSLGIRHGLERVTRLLSLLGSPEKKFPAVQVLGTNGKGSTAATLESICEASGLRTALYTSPHLSSLSERIRIRKGYAGIVTWREAFERVVRAVESDSLLDSVRPTFFENLTALAFLIMSESDIDIAIVEAGMGGRYDATSVCNSIATVITPIGMDHMEYLGDTLQGIAGEKFAAIREGVPAFYAADDEALSRPFSERCESAGAPSYLISRIAFPRNIRCTLGVLGELGKTSFDYARVENEEKNISGFAVNPETGLQTMYGLKTPLIGIHQAYNASNAITVLLELKKTVPLFRSIGETQIRDGLSAVDWPGRMEIYPGGPGSSPVLLDGAHNEHGFAALVESLSHLRESGHITGIGAVIFAVMKDKDITGIAKLLKGLNAPVFPTRLGMPRAKSAADLAAFLKESGCETRGAWEDPASALAAARASTRPGDLILCCGSLFLVGAMKDILTGRA